MQEQDAFDEIMNSIEEEKKSEEDEEEMKENDADAYNVGNRRVQRKKLVINKHRVKIPPS